MKTETVLVQTRVDADVAIRLRRYAVDQGGISLAGAVRRILTEKMRDVPVALDVAAMESRISDRVRALEERVSDLERVSA